ncbi:MAG: polysaccharide deacetylase family protein, partial [Pseudomonadota bacterium]
FLERLLEEFRREDVDLVTLDEALLRMKSEPSGRPFLAVTFDDGYRDNFENAYPILKHFDVPFTVFPCTGFVDRTTPIWWLSLEAILCANKTLSLAKLGTGEQIQVGSSKEKWSAFNVVARFLRSLPHYEGLERFRAFAEDHDHDALGLVDTVMADWPMIRDAASDPIVSIGAHTITHPMLASLTPDEARSEMIGGADRIEEMIGRRPLHIAYPYGFQEAVGEREVALAQECGFEVAFTTRKGLLYREHLKHTLALPRVSVNGYYQDMNAMRALLSGLPFFLANRFNRIATV